MVAYKRILYSYPERDRGLERGEVRGDECVHHDKVKVNLEVMRNTDTGRRRRGRTVGVDETNDTASSSILASTTGDWEDPNRRNGLVIIFDVVRFAGDRSTVVGKDVGHLEVALGIAMHTADVGGFGVADELRVVFVAVESGLRGIRHARVGEGGGRVPEGIAFRIVAGGVDRTSVARIT